MGRGARIVVIGQAPGSKVHDSGRPWQDDSGRHLRQWLNVDEQTFYDPKRVGLIPMGFCYPGKGRGGDAPPRPECAPLWHESLVEHASKHALFLLVGQYAHRYYLGNEREKTLTETVKVFKRYLPRYLPLPHPSWRSKVWMEKNPWFQRRVLPILRKEVEQRLSRI
jgi:uracil-DNA glycosylase